MTKIPTSSGFLLVEATGIVRCKINRTIHNIVSSLVFMVVFYYFNLARGRQSPPPPADTGGHRLNQYDHASSTAVQQHVRRAATRRAPKCLTSKIMIKMHRLLATSQNNA